MAISPSNSLKNTLSAIIILTILSFFSSCASHAPATVDERSKQYVYKGRLHEVVRGETLHSIAWHYSIDYKKLAEINGLSAPYLIYPHQQLRLDFSPQAEPVSATINASSPAIENGNKRDIRSKSDNSIRSKNKTKNELLPLSEQFSQGAPKWQWPASGKLLALFESSSGLNKGIDLSGKLGEPVLAAASGQVVYAGDGLGAYGKLLIIKHSDIFLSAYAHNKELLVKEGEIVKAGQRIADMGSSGTDRVKLHFEIRSEGNPVDPLNYLPKLNRAKTYDK